MEPRPADRRLRRLVGVSVEEKMTMPDEIDSPTYWIIVGSVDNFRRTAERGFTVQGIKSRHRKKAERMKPGDKIVYYLTGIKAFGAMSTITSPYYESHEVIWK